jgi:hypothetical protein
MAICKAAEGLCNVANDICNAVRAVCNVAHTPVCTVTNDDCNRANRHCGPANIVWKWTLHGIVLRAMSVLYCSCYRLPASTGQSLPAANVVRGPRNQTVVMFEHESPTSSPTSRTGAAHTQLQLANFPLGKPHVSFMRST